MKKYWPSVCFFVQEGAHMTVQMTVSRRVREFDVDLQYESFNIICAPMGGVVGFKKRKRKEKRKEKKRRQLTLPCRSMKLRAREITAWSSVLIRDWTIL